MSEQQKAVVAQKDQAGRAAWRRPGVRRLEAGQAEGAAGFGGDNVVFS